MRDKSVKSPVIQWSMWIVGTIGILFLFGYCTREPGPAVYLSDGRRVTCRGEAFNCPNPSYTRNVHKKLKTCADVALVFRTCNERQRRDVHGLDTNDDGRPCEEDCEF